MAREQPTSADPFASIGGGVYAQGGWKPRGMYSSGALAAYDAGGEPIDAAGAPDSAPAPAGAVPAGPAAPAPAPTSPDPFASLGGGTPTANGGWLPPGYPAGNGLVTQPGGGAPGLPGQTPTTPSGPVDAPPGVTKAPLATNVQQIATPFYQTLDRLLRQSETPSANDPDIKDTLNAARAEEERNFTRQRSMMAERAAAEGTSMSGGFDTALMNARAGIGARQGQLAASLLTDAKQQRMAQIMTALSIGAGQMSDSDRNQLQRELADLDASLRQEGFGVQREQIAAGKEESAAERALRQALADQSTGFQYAQLGQQGSQFGQNLAANLGMHEADLQQALIIALLGQGQGV